MANTTNRTTRIKHVYGNVLKLAIPLTLRTVTLEGGIVEVTDTDYTPSNHYPVVVQFVNGPLKYELDATIRDNYIAVVEDKGTIPVGNYAIVVLCKDDNGDPRRFKQRCVLEVVDVTADAGIEVGIEFEAQEWLLDGAIFLAIKGEDGIDGVGIESITTDETSVSGEYNQVTFHLTNGSSYTLNVRNGESTEQTLPANVVVDENYVHTDNNYTDTDKQKIESVDKLFGDAEYDRISRRLNFFKHGDTMHTNPLKSIDITDFIRDSRVSSFRIVDGNLTIKLNSDGNNEEFKVPITSINANYYTKAQTDAKLSQKVNLDATTGRVDASQATRVVLDYIVGIYDGEDEPSHDVNAGDVWYDNGQIHYAYNNDVIVVIKSLGAPQKDIIYCNAENNKLYRWNGSEFVQVGGGNSDGGYEPPVGGIPKSDLAQSVQDTLDDVSNKVDKVAGKGLSTEDYTTAEKQKLAGLNNYDDTEIQAEVDAKYEKPSTGIPKTDLASDVQASLGKADTALQSSDLEGYATTDDVDDAVAALVSSAPQTLDTLNELAEALGDDPNFATTMATQLGNKVDKETGKGLSTNDYTTAEKTKLAGLENYDDSALQTAIGGKVDKETGKSLMSDAEHTKLAGIDPSTYATKTEVNAKQDTINDLDAIRSGAALGATALQSFTETDPTVPSWAKQSSKPTYTAQEVGALPATTTIPTKTSDLTNDSGFIDKAMYYGTSDTAAATMPKVCTVETFPTYTNNGVTHAKEGTIIAVKFTNSDTNTTDAPSLNVNGIGAKAIMYNNAIVTSTAKNTTVAGYAKQIAYYRYDPDLDEGNGAWEYLGKSVDSNSTYSNASLGQGYGTQTNSSAATAITSSISSYSLSSGGIVTIKFTYDVPANATLNINSKGAKTIYNQGAAITTGVIKAGDTATFVYSTYYHLIAVDSWQDKQDTISDLATIRSGAAAGATAAQPADIPTKVSDLTNDSGFTSNAGTITGITMNGVSKGTSGVVDLGTVITAHQDISGKANASDVYTKTQTDTLLSGKQNTLTFDSTPTASSTNPVTSGGIKTYVDGKASITGITTSQDGTFTIALSDGNSYTVNLNHVHPQYLKYELLEDEAEYTALATKDSSTLYLIPEA